MTTMTIKLPDDIEIITICGSRDMTPGMIEYIHALVKRCVERGYWIISGDCPQGVDLVVANACHNHKAIYGVVGIGELPRFGVSLEHYSQAVAKSYTERDRFLVELSTRIFCLWNGVSPGTAKAAAYARELGKEAHLIKDFKGWIGK